jgi:hypothetical protein
MRAPARATAGVEDIGRSRIRQVGGRRMHRSGRGSEPAPVSARRPGRKSRLWPMLGANSREYPLGLRFACKESAAVAPGVWSAWTIEALSKRAQATIDPVQRRLSRDLTRQSLSHRTPHGATPAGRRPAKTSGLRAGWRRVEHPETHASKSPIPRNLENRTASSGHRVSRDLRRGRTPRRRARPSGYQWPPSLAERGASCIAKWKRMPIGSRTTTRNTSS